MTIYANSCSITTYPDKMCKLIFTDQSPINNELPVNPPTTEIVMPEWAMKAFRDILYAQYPEEGTRQ